MVRPVVVQVLTAQNKNGTRNNMNSKTDREKQAQEQQYTCEHCETFTGTLVVVQSHEAVRDSKEETKTNVNKTN